MAGGRDHDRVDREEAQVAAAGAIDGQLDECARAQHAGLRRVDGDVVEDRVVLVGDEVRVDGIDPTDAVGVLRDESGDDGRAIGAERGEGLEIRVDARPAGRVSARDRERDRRTVGGGCALCDG